MKMVKSLLLGSAAGLVAVSAAQAADLPVKAKAVEYVKVCTLYGAGFYYIPGTDTCIKIGGFVRTEWNHNAQGSFSPTTNGSDALYTRTGQTLINRSRIIATFDVRSQTEYGTLRAYARAGWQWTSGDFQVGGSQCASSLTGGVGNSVAAGVGGASTAGVPAGWAASSSCTYLDRAFIQFAGFTFGKTQSYFDFFNTAAYSLQTNLIFVDTGGHGVPVFAYTAQWGNGLSATISAEDYTESRQPIVSLPAINTSITTTLFPAGGSNPSFHAGNFRPDIVGNIRVDQAWGSAQVMGALHNVRASYYHGGTTATADNQTAHPKDKWGHAFGGGITLKMPWDPKDTFSGMVTYCKGAVRYCSNPAGGILGSGRMFGLVNENKIGLGWADDAYFDGSIIGSSLELSKAWSGVAAFEHYWTPTLRSSIYGAYMKYEANSATVDRACAQPNGGAVIGNAILGGNNAPFGPGCADWKAYQVGTRTIWNPVANLDIGLDIMYTKLSTAFAGGTFSSTTQGLNPNLVIANTHVWAGILRLQRNFWP
jgi:porin-like protein